MNETDPVIFELDLPRPAALTPEQRAELEALAATPDSEIDYSDIPPLTEAFFANAQRNPFYRPIKAQVTVRLDADVLAWLKTGGRGYQTKLNAILRRAMLQDVPPK
ncbi:BrnA antitoxin family protein [Methylobacterium sp. Leaf100]|uniref:BrnA antitoxin family protein n=1 Tax=Methylobacterium sp. Leaf100 TaxID=1736252 RepID=UPI0006FC5EBA|nr:BrnA antitoxin family protein [Methylobacterium sp. Leaf100]KQP36866.1 cytoplasmic protein [Methylobacterium sp. Leaf100]